MPNTRTPNTRKQESLRRVEKAVGARMPRELYRHLSQIPSTHIDAIGEWIENVASGKHKDPVLPLDDFEA